MKRIFVLFLTFAAVPCLAQWKSDVGNAQVVAFGVHDTSFFYSEDHGMTRANPDGEADAGLDFTQGNFTTFASLGTILLTGSSNGNIGALSTNDGSSWKTVISGPVAANNKFVFASYGYHIARSTDGINWDHLSIMPQYVSSYGVNDNCIYATTGDLNSSTIPHALWRSLDTGNSWTQLSAPFYGTLMTMGTLLFMCQPYYYFDPSKTPTSGILLMSRDSGQNWDTVRVDSAGTPELVTAFATDGTNLFAGGDNANTPDVGSNGVYVSTDTGKSWRAVNDGLGKLDITAFGVYDSNLYAAAGHGFPYATYYRPIGEIVDTSPSEVVQIPSGDTILVYPNPATSQVSILSGGTSIFGVEVLNVLGESVLSVPKSYGSEMTLDLSKLPSGTYFVEIQTAKGVVLREVVRE